MDLGTINATSLKPDMGSIRPVVVQAKSKRDFSDGLAIDPARVDFSNVEVPESVKPEDTAVDKEEPKDQAAAATALPADTNAVTVNPLINMLAIVQIADTGNVPIAGNVPDASVLNPALSALNSANGAALLAATPDNSKIVAGNIENSLLTAIADPDAQVAASALDPAFQNLLNKNMSAPVTAQKPNGKAATASADTLSPTPAANSPLPLSPSSPKDAAGAPNSDPSSLRLSRQAPANGKDLASMLTADAKADVAAPALPAGSQPIQIQTPAPVDYKNVQAAVVAAQPVAEQVAVQIIKAAKDGVDKIKIQLSPENLGRVTVHLEMDKDALVKAVIATDKPEAAEWLQRDAKQLERALQDAGIKADTSNMEFQNRNSSSNPHFANQFSDNYNSQHASHKYYGAKNGMADINPDANIIVKNLYVRDGGLNIMV